MGASSPPPAPALITRFEHAASSRDEDGEVSKLRHQLPHRGMGEDHLRREHGCVGRYISLYTMQAQDGHRSPFLLS